MSAAGQFTQYVAAGWGLCALRPGTKAPSRRNWRSPAAVAQAAKEAATLAAAGLVHERSGTCALDVDNLEGARELLSGRGVDLDALLNDPGAVRIDSGRPGRAKLLYRLPAGHGALRTHKLRQGGVTALELRCAGGQDVLPPSLHPDTGAPYAWRGDWRSLPELPDEMLQMWQQLDAPAEVAEAPRPQGATSDLLRAHLAALPRAAKDDRDQWLRVGMALHHETSGSAEGEALWSEWSEESPKFDAADLQRVWASFGKAAGGPLVTLGSLASLWDDSDPAAVDARHALVAQEFEDVSATSEGADPGPDWRQFFAPVRTTDLAEEPPLEWFWAGYLPGGEVTLLAADGGVGKSFLALALAVSIAAGVDFLGQQTQRAPVLFVSAEDDAHTLRRRLRTVLDALGHDAAPEGLHLVDSTARPELFAFTQSGRDAAPTKAMAALGEALAATSARVLMVDNASNAFAADENARTQANAFVRALKALVLPSGGAALLLAHVDKNTSRAGALATAAYSGSTAWHNAVRSRIYLVKTAKKGLELQHHKSTHGVELPPLALQRLPGGPLALVAAEVAQARDPAAFLPLLRVVSEFNQRGEWVSPHTNARNNAGKLLAQELGCAPLAAVDLCREAQRAGLLAIETFTNHYRNQAARWVLTPAGDALAAGGDLV